MVLWSDFFWISMFRLGPILPTVTSIGLLLGLSIGIFRHGWWLSVLRVMVIVECGFYIFLLVVLAKPGSCPRVLDFSILEGLSWSIYIDNLSLMFIALTLLLMPLCMLYMRKVVLNAKLLTLLLVILEVLLINAFLTVDLLFFYIFFESVLIPMGLIIGIWGSRERKIHAFFLFFIYTLFGSLLFLVALMCIYSHCQSTDFLYIKTCGFSPIREKFVWACMFLAFAVKIPMVPFHVWLPEAHTEAPTIGSVLLAAVLLKLGSYGMFKYLFLFSRTLTIWLFPLILILCLVGALYISLIAIRQIDIKKIIAYSSIAHMSYVVVGAATLTAIGSAGSVVLMIGHGLVSGGLFFCIGALYERYKTRNIKYYGGLSLLAPELAFVFLFLTLANTAFPGTINFVGEFLIMLGVLLKFGNLIFTLLFLFGIVLCSVYAFWLFNRIFCGPSKMVNTYASSKREQHIFGELCFLILIIGICPSCVFNFWVYFTFSDESVNFGMLVEQIKHTLWGGFDFSRSFTYALFPVPYFPIDFWFDPDFWEFNPLIQVENETKESDVILLMDDEEIISEQETLTLSPLPIFEEDFKGHIKEMYLYSSQEYKRSRELRGKLFRFFFAVSDADEPVIKEPWAVLHFPQWQPRYWAASWVWQWGLYEWLEYSNDLYDVWITACDWKMDVTKVEPNIWEIRFVRGGGLWRDETDD